MAAIDRSRVRKPWRASEAKPRKWLGVLGILSFVLAWQVAALVVGDPSTLARPIDVAERFIEMLVQPFAGSTLGWHLLASLGRFFAGFGLAVVIGIPLGLAMSWYSVLDAVIAPFFNLFRFIAPIAWVPFAVLWFGIGLGGPVLIIFSGAFAPCLIGSYGGGKLTDVKLLEAARTVGASGFKIITEVILPSAIPSIVAGLRVAAGNGWQSLVGAELIVASSGVAYTMVRGQMNRTITIVMVGMIAIGIVGLVMEWLFRRLEIAVHRRFGIHAAT
ncbi:MAG TPA: ABC transporter permease [Bradyrhizobium sp.]|nr:ABC transporter permease [Bradyrhizobium sp.]